MANGGSLRNQGKNNRNQGKNNRTQLAHNTWSGSDSMHAPYRRALRIVAVVIQPRHHVGHLDLAFTASKLAEGVQEVVHLPQSVVAGKWARVSGGGQMGERQWWRANGQDARKLRRYRRICQSAPSARERFGRWPQRQLVPVGKLEHTRAYPLHLRQ